jgi:hypothetical protein
VIEEKPGQMGKIGPEARYTDISDNCSLALFVRTCIRTTCKESSIYVVMIEAEAGIKSKLLCPNFH